MYSALLVVHSVFRWLVLASLLIAIVHAFNGYRKNISFSDSDNSLRHWTATIAQIQMTIGVILYIKSPLIHYFWKNISEAGSSTEALFFGSIHIILMMTAVVFVTIGSAFAKRKNTGREKYKTMLIWFSVTLVIILIAIPWSFSPLASRPYFRTF